MKKSNREDWEYSSEIIYGSLQHTPKAQRESVAHNYLDAILVDLSAVIDYLETSANEDPGEFFSSTEWRTLEEILYPEKFDAFKDHPAWYETQDLFNAFDRDRNFVDTTHAGVLKRYKEVRETLTGWKTNILEHTQEIEDIYEHQWFCRISTVLINCI